MRGIDLGTEGCALVTGASRGIGRVIALQMSALGMPVAINYVRSEAEAQMVVRTLTEQGGRAVALQADMASEAAAAGLIERTERALGPVAIVVNNAGITRDRLLIQMSEEDWSATWDTDLVGPRALGRRAVTRMAERGYGRVVNISSVVGSTGNSGQANYASAKSALHGLTRELALIGANSGVTVNCVIPGFFETDATSHLNEEQRMEWLTRIPMGRYGSVEELAAMVVFLASKDAGYVTGQCIAVDGGFTARSGQGLAS